MQLVQFGYFAKNVNLHIGRLKQKYLSRLEHDQAEVTQIMDDFFINFVMQYQQMCKSSFVNPMTLANNAILLFSIYVQQIQLDANKITRNERIQLYLNYFIQCVVVTFFHVASDEIKPALNKLVHKLCKFENQQIRLNQNEEVQFYNSIFLF